MPYRLRESVEFLKGHLAVLLLLSNSFSWYFFGQLVVVELTDSFKSLAVVFPLSIILSALAGSALLVRFERRRVLSGWVFLGTAVSLLPALQVNDSFGGTLAVVAVLGGSLGLGMPLLLGHFSKSSPVENHGTIGGFTFFLVTVSASLIIAATRNALDAHDMVSSAVALALWRCWSIPVVLASPAKPEDQTPREKRTAFHDLFNNRAFVLYFMAWLMFSMVDGFAGSAISQHIENQSPGELRDRLDFGMNIVEPLCAGMSALVGGIIADRTGRRRAVISGFVSLGIAYAVLGITGPVLGETSLSASLPLYFVVDGFAIGLLWTMFTIAIWGELTARGTEKYYALGEAPFFLTQTLYLISTPYFGANLQTSFPLAAFFLFIAVIPLFYAPETLPEKKIQDRQLRVYTEEAIKLKQKSQPA